MSKFLIFEHVLKCPQVKGEYLNSRYLSNKSILEANMLGFLSGLCEKSPESCPVVD